MTQARVSVLPGLTFCRQRDRRPAFRISGIRCGCPKMGA